MIKPFAINRAPQGIRGWRKDGMPPGTWSSMIKPDGTIAPEVIIACPKCGGDIILDSTQALGKKSAAHVSRQLFDPRKGRGTKTQMCGAQFMFRRDKNCAEIIT
jgi:hypothetical protein